MKFLERDNGCRCQACIKHYCRWVQEYDRFGVPTRVREATADDVRVNEPDVTPLWQGAD
jgi:hypothetical protein